MKLIALIEKSSVGYPVSIGIVVIGVACILWGFLAFGCIDGGFGLGLMIQVGQANGHYPIPPEGKRGELPVVVRAGICSCVNLFWASRCCNQFGVSREVFSPALF
jgi:hypothetical protein